MRLIAILTLATCSFAIDQPTIGTMLDRSGHTRPVYGIPGSFVLGEAVENATPAELPDGIVVTQDTVTVGGVTLRVEGVKELFPIGPEFIGARSEVDTFAIRITHGREAVYYLPEE